MRYQGFLPGALLLSLALLVGCGDSSARARTADGTVESCMQCHNGAKNDNYTGPGLENPHPFPGADELACTTCHGGNPNGADKDGSHVPAPPEIGDREEWRTNPHAYFNRLTLTGIDKFPDYVVDGQTYTALDYLQFINPSDLRVVTQGRSCGQCHAGHAATVAASPIATEMGVLSGAMYAAGVAHADGNTNFSDTAVDKGFRAVTDPNFSPAEFGTVPSIREFPVYSRRFNAGPDDLRNNPDFLVANMAGDLDAATNSPVAGSPLEKLYHEQIAFTCGDCHLGSAGANNRTGDYRSSGCAACHMRYSVNGRSTSNDPNLDRTEPFDPDDIDEPELPHVRRHLIQSVAKTLPSGEFVQGIDDYACAGCHQGSNRTVMQYWGIRLDQNEDLRRGFQYPDMPVDHENTRNDPRLFGFEGRPDRGNNREFNGRDHDQYIRFEDYDGDNRDDTPADVHYEAGMGCIDCHGSYDLHGGDPGDPKIVSRMEQAVAIRCESCHGGVDGYAPVVSGTAHDGTTADLATDAAGNPLPHVVREADGHYYLYSRLTGARHYVPQTRDFVVDTGRTHPLTNPPAPLYSQKASYAMGRDDGDAGTGLGPNQGGPPTGFRHGDNMDCASCHASWTNTCMGCHLKGEYDNGNNFSNITGDRIVFEEDEAQFVYQSPLFFTLGVNSHNKITQTSSNTKMFFQWEDSQNQLSQIYAFSDRNARGNTSPFASLGHNAIMAHSIRGKVSATNEGPRYCVACHLTTDGLTQYGAAYENFRGHLANGRYDQLDFDELKEHFGRNPGNTKNSPFFVHMVAGLGTGLFLFDEKGCAVNPLDNNDERYGCFADAEQNVRVSPASVFTPETMLARVRFDLDRIVDENGVPTGSSNHPLLPNTGPSLRAGTPNPSMAGPLGPSMIRRLTNPLAPDAIILTGWLDADGDPHGTAPGASAAPPQTSGD